jgi:Ion transport protein
LIALNSLLLIINSPSIEEAYFDDTINNMTTIISMFFVGEAVIKIISMGFVIGEDTYLKDSWNILDFVIVFSSILNWFFDFFFKKSFTFIRGFRALRALRPLRMISKDEGMKTIVNSLLKAIPSLFNVALINILFFVVFGILGVQIFKGQIGYCNDETIEYKIKCTGKFMLDGVKTDREWIVPFNNFNNVLWSMITFFELATLEGWPNTLLQIIDS